MQNLIVIPKCNPSYDHEQTRSNRGLLKFNPLNGSFSSVTLFLKKIPHSTIK